MSNNKVIVLGDGLLGNEIIKQQSHWHYVSRKKDGIDFTKLYSYAGFLSQYDVIVNCIANTDTYSLDRDSMWNVNYKAVADLADYCEAFHKKLCHISTDFIYAGSSQPAKETDIPIPAENWYSLTKLLSDTHVQMRMTNFLIVRGSFKPNPFPYAVAYKNLIGNFLYVDEFASLLIKLIKKNATGVYNLGAKESKTMADFARQTRDDVRSEIGWTDPSMPEFVEMDTSKLWEFLGDKV
jgi:dTDP-4-dehydrorhamnose reductase